MNIYRKANKAFKTIADLLCLAAAIAFSFPSALLAYDFGDVRKSLEKDVSLWRPESGGGKIAIIYNYSDHNQIKQRFNLVELKKDLSHELSKSFEVADPVIVHRIMDSNNLNYRRLVKDRSVFREFVDRVDCSLALMVDLNLRGDALASNMTVLDSSHTRVSNVDLEIPQESEEIDFEPIGEEQRGSLFGADFSSPYAERQTDSWMYFVPSANIGSNQHSLTLSLSFRDLAEVDIQPNYIRYDFSYAETLQFGIQSYAISKKIEDKDDLIPRANFESDKGHHSTYASIKYRVVDENVLPVNISLGLRGRVACDEDNVEFNYEKYAEDEKKDAEEIDDRNKRLNALTLQAIVSGEVQQLGLMYNFYLDNQAAAAGARIFVLPSIRLMGDFIYYWQDEPVVQSDAAFGVEILNKLGVTALNYQWETSQIQVEMTFNF